MPPLGHPQLTQGEFDILAEWFYRGAPNVNDVLAPTLAILPYDTAAAAWHAAERARLEARGRTPPFVGGQIAAVARVRGLTLVTRNVGDYDDFDGLVVEDWSA